MYFSIQQRLFGEGGRLGAEVHDRRAMMANLRRIDTQEPNACDLLVAVGYVDFERVTIHDVGDAEGLIVIPRLVVGLPGSVGGPIADDGHREKRNDDECDGMSAKVRWGDDGIG